MVVGKDVHLEEVSAQRAFMGVLCFV
jgi:hypothetical protein